MACTGIHNWTVSALISIFFKLVLAFVLLWVASISFLVSQFLGFFGLRLPCSCNDFAKDQNATTGSMCLQGALIECPSRMIDSIRGHTLGMFPFKWYCTPKQDASPSNVNAVLLNGPCDPLLSAPLVLKGGPCHHNSLGPQDYKRIDREAHLENPNTQTEITDSGSGGYAVGEKQVCQQGLCCLHCFGNSHPNNSRSVIQFKGKIEQGPLQKGEANPLQKNSQNSVIVEGNNSLSTTSTGDNQLDTKHPGASDFYANATLDKDSPSDEFFQLQGSSSMLELDGLHSSNDLKRALIKERETRKALCKELEEEQKAAATAAEEAMAMISRLQSEKASIEMEARQFKRMVEEKSAYDEAAMEFILEILVRLERERFDLKDELEVYRQSPLGDRIDKWERRPNAGSNENGSGYYTENGEHVEDNSTIHDVHVVRTPTNRDPERNTACPSPPTPDRYKQSDRLQLQGIIDKGLHRSENNVLNRGKSPSISSSCAYENPSSRTVQG